MEELPGKNGIQLLELLRFIYYKEEFRLRDSPPALRAFYYIGALSYVIKNTPNPYEYTGIRGKKSGISYSRESESPYKQDQITPLSWLEAD